MKKGASLVLLLLAVGIFLISFNHVSALSCSLSGYNNFHGDLCAKNTVCDYGNCPSPPSSTQCETNQRSSSWTDHGTYWSCKRYTGNTCTRCSWSCGVTYGSAYCSGGLGYRNRQDPSSCGSSCDGCNYGSAYAERYSSYDSNCCAPSLTAANYSGQCGSGFSDGCTNSLTLTCPTGDHCSVASGQGICLPDTVIGKPYFANLINSSKNISTASINSTVLMVVPGLGLTSAINYTLWENLAFWFDSKLSSSTTLGINSWIANRTGTFYFTARINNLFNKSDDLLVSGIGNKYPVVILNTPQNGIKISTNVNINFTQSSYDEDDLLNITWNFGDGASNKTTGYSFAFTPLAANTLHNYSTAGEKIVTLTAAESSRTQSNSTSITLYVFKAGINVVPIIASPVDGTNVPNDIVRFNASASYVANCSASIIPNLAFNISNGVLNCSYVHAPNTKVITGNYSLILNWTFNDGVRVIGNWSNYSGVVDFTKIYTQSGTYTANLTLIYKPFTGLTEIGGRETTFLTNGGWYCDAGETSAFWRKSGSSPFDATLNCTKYSDSSCCPLNRNICQENGTCTGLTNGTGPASFCDDLKTAYTCTHASDDIVFNSIPNSVMCDQITANQIGGKNCYNQTSCGCVWKNNACSPSFSSDYFCDNEPPVPYGECYWSTAREDKCNETENSIILRGTHIWNPIIGTPEVDPICADYVKSIPCVSSAKLPFFDKINAMFVLLGLVIVYFLFSKKFR